MKKDGVSRNLQGLLMVAVAAAAMPIPNAVFAQGNLQGSVSTLHTGLLDVPNIVAGLFYIGGASLIGAGLLMLKRHAENPTQEPLGKGIGRVAAGAGLIAMPAFGTWLNNTLAIGNTAATSQSLGTIQ